MESLLAWLPLLACPLMMLFCMKGMFEGKKCEDNGEEAMNRSTTTVAEKTELAQLKAQVANLQREQAALLARLESESSVSQPSVSLPLVRRPSANGRVVNGRTGEQPLETTGGAEHKTTC